MSKRKQSAELTIMTLWPTLSPEGQRIIGDWIASQVKAAKGTVVRAPRSDRGKSRQSNAAPAADNAQKSLPDA